MIPLQKWTQTRYWGARAERQCSRVAFQRWLACESDCESAKAMDSPQPAVWRQHSQQSRETSLGKVDPGSFSHPRASNCWRLVLAILCRYRMEEDTALPPLYQSRVNRLKNPQSPTGPFTSDPNRAKKFRASRTMGFQARRSRTGLRGFPSRTMGFQARRSNAGLREFQAVRWASKPVDRMRDFENSKPYDGLPSPSIEYGTSGIPKSYDRLPSPSIQYGTSGIDGLGSPSYVKKPLVRVENRI